MKVTAVVFGVSVSDWHIRVAVIYRAPFSIYRRLEISISCMSSRVGTAIPASRSTALSSSAVGLTRSIQTALSGSAARSTATAFLSEKSEGTKTENIHNSGTGYLVHNGIARFWQGLDDWRINLPSSFAAAKRHHHGAYTADV